MNNANSEIGKGLISLANILLVLIFLQPYINDKIKFSEVLNGILFWIIIYLIGWSLNFKESKDGN